MKRTLVKMLIIVAAVGGFAWLFVHSAQSVRSEPYEIARGKLSGWTLALDSAPNASGVLLGLRPDPQTAAVLFGQVFSRAGTGPLSVSPVREKTWPNSTAAVCGSGRKPSTTPEAFGAESSASVHPDSLLRAIS